MPKFDRTAFIRKFISESRDNIQRLNECALAMERAPDDTKPLHDMMRLTHTIKGSAKMLNLAMIGDLAHGLEDGLYAIQKTPIAFTGPVVDLVFRTLDKMDEMLTAIAADPDGRVDATVLTEALQLLAANQVDQLTVLRTETKVTPAPVVKTTTRSMPFDKSAFINRFALEADDHIGYLRAALERLQVVSDNDDVLQTALRAAHTLKGSARMMKFENIGNLSQRVESVFQAVRQRKIQWSPSVQTSLTLSLDALRDLTQLVRASGEDTFRNTSIIDVLDQIAAGASMTPDQIEKAFATRPEPVDVEGTQPVISDQDVVDRLGERLVQARLISREQLIHANQTTDPTVPLGERLIALGYLTREKLNLMLKEQQASRILLGHSTRTDIGPVLDHETPVAGKGAAALDQSIRVQIDKIDALIKSVGELTTSQLRHQVILNELRQVHQSLRQLVKNVQKHGPFAGNGSRDPEEADHESEASVLQQASRVFEAFDSVVKTIRDEAAGRDVLANEIQQGVMGMRMIPISAIFDAYPRAVRDLAKILGKEVRLVIEGGSTELDRKMVEQLNEPLIHLVRNAIDHGIEPPDVRQRIGKSREGFLRISARNEGSSIVIDIEEDGRGIDFEKVKIKAVEKHLIGENEDINRFSENDLLNLIFVPGFSTNDFITDISGRGYGMDVVKQCVESLKGYISVDSQKDYGSRFSIHLPLTLTSLRALFVEVGRQVYALPVSSISETLQVARKDIIKIVDKNAIRLRNQLIPVLVLGDVLNVPGGSRSAGDQCFVVIAHAGGDRVGFLVDDILDEKDIIVKSLPDHFARVRHISSASISADNRVILILHVPDLIMATKDFSIREKPEAKEKVLQTILVVDDSLNTREVEKTILQAYGYQVDTAKDGLDALEKIGQKEYHLIVTDLEMPAMDGFTLTSKLKGDLTLQHIPVIIVTSRDSADDKRRGIEVGANAYIVKGSFDQTNLIDTVESLIG